ncbi:SDR family oxidoreductase [Mycolicibacterium aichiense]|uniref:Short-chain dehydrogenase/reductase n=2 Tax=Mycolicibacterium TaxID=1866885 RepID=A0AAD1HRX3_9MYCO|nr:SDR family oxidoreductase [Mycolicibacterium aichiense]MCV7016959.1 SDR family oxidoreductase [Mycolicibacterium aichiense]BBX10618.1 short-chain dehydrogenase/reductase [Mycolicibacterium aichiense]STZ25726.1 short-chain alcohol dehydrogenase [Mycolicibacterium aichiense]
MPTVLVTGAARGIGKSIVDHLVAAGWDVIGGVRSDADAEALSKLPRVRAVTLDITDDAQVAALADALPARLDAVVNNAGIAVSGPLEGLTPAEIRRQLEVNVVGQLAVTQAVLPLLRQSRGRIVFISSVNGQLSAPMMGAYSASKFALEAAADALRIELRPWGIAVSVVQPAQTDTDLWRDADRSVVEMEAALSPQHRVLYSKHVAGMRKSIPASQRMAVDPEKVAKVVLQALTARKPRARYPVGLPAALQMTLMTKLPTGPRDAVLRRVLGQP